MNNGFRTCGFYLHMHWSFNYPFAVRSWQEDDYLKMFRLLRELGYDIVMVWPYMEKITTRRDAEIDRDWLTMIRGIIHDAQSESLECWITVPANIGPDEDRMDLSEPVKDRVFFKDLKVYCLNEENERKQNLERIESVVSHIDNADGYVFIDTDPGSYPGGDPAEFTTLLNDAAEVIHRNGAYPECQKVIPWLWGGWGNAREDAVFGGWNKDLAPYIEPVMQQLKDDPLPEPFEYLVGRSHLDKSSFQGGHANGRLNIELAERFNLVPESTLFTYEIIEFEPCCPAFKVQFDLIRDVFNREKHLARTVKGVFGNAQQPVDALHNIFFFARSARDFDYLGKSDEQVLKDFSVFLGGDPKVLGPAINCLNLDLTGLPDDLPGKVRNAKLDSEIAQLIPGGAERYLEILASFVNTRMQVLKNTGSAPATFQQLLENSANALIALMNWWEQHQYTGTGLGPNHYDGRFCDSALYAPFREWSKRQLKDSKMIKYDIVRGVSMILDKRLEITPLLSKQIVENWYLENAPGE